MGFNGSVGLVVVAACRASWLVGPPSPLSVVWHRPRRVRLHHLWQGTCGVIAEKKLNVGFKVKSLRILTCALMLASRWKSSFSTRTVFRKGSIFYFRPCFGVQNSSWKVTLVRCGLCFSLGSLHASSVTVSFVFSSWAVAARWVCAPPNWWRLKWSLRIS